MNLSKRINARRAFGPAAFVLFAATLFLLPALIKAQTYSSGQPVWPAFEGWEKNDDGSFSLLFGYMNDNWEEEPYVPIGPDNNSQPGGPDQGQPTHFQPRRNRFMFRIRVPKDFGQKELVWTLTTQGKAQKAFGSLRPDLEQSGTACRQTAGHQTRRREDADSESRPAACDHHGDD